LNGSTDLLKDVVPDGAARGSFGHPQPTEQLHQPVMIDVCGVEDAKHQGAYTQQQKLLPSQGNLIEVIGSGNHLPGCWQGIAKEGESRQVQHDAK
jgi:hypothetical protein